MSLICFFRWTCDDCPVTEEKQAYGLPKGWLYLPQDMGRNQPASHLCPACQQRPALSLLGMDSDNDNDKV
jgi:hypothetical protein